MTELKQIIQKNKNGQIQISKVKSYDKIQIDIRTFYISDDDKYYPSKQGVRFNESLLDEIINALKSI